MEVLCRLIGNIKIKERALKKKSGRKTISASTQEGSVKKGCGPARPYKDSLSDGAELSKSVGGDCPAQKKRDNKTWVGMPDREDEALREKSEIGACTLEPVKRSG